MGTKEQIENDMKDAMRAKDDLRKRTLRMVLSAIKLKEVEKRQALDETETLAVIQKEVKSRQETIVDAERANRPEQVAESQAEINILEAYLPEPLTPEELETFAKEAIEEVGATSMREMGQVMKVLIPRLEGRATGSEASQTVRKLLG
ncbi:MAG: GatB/YqeY domain-containing protein [Anaerolineales bacterium]